MDSESGSEDEMDTQDIIENGYAVGGQFDYKKKKRFRRTPGVNLMNPGPLPSPHFGRSQRP